jgi:hypothetical protein
MLTLRTVSLANLLVVNGDTEPSIMPAAGGAGSPPGPSDEVLSQILFQLDSLTKSNLALRAKVGLVPMCRSLTDGLITVPRFILSLLHRERPQPPFLLLQDPLSPLFQVHPAGTQTRLINGRTDYLQRLPPLLLEVPPFHGRSEFHQGSKISKIHRIPLKLRRQILHPVMFRIVEKRVRHRY